MSTGAWCWVRTRGRGGGCERRGWSVSALRPCKDETCGTSEGVKDAVTTVVGTLRLRTSRRWRRPMPGTSSIRALLRPVSAG